MEHIRVFINYGDQHLFNSIYFYISEGIKNHELIYISMKEDLYNKLINFLKINNVSPEHIKFKSIKELIEINTQGGQTELKKIIESASLENEVKEYNGIRWIGQPSYAIHITSQEAFLNFETNLSDALNNTNVSLLCIYDAYDYMNKGEFINETVIKQSLITHSFILKNSALEKIN